MCGKGHDLEWWVTSVGTCRVARSGWQEPGHVERDHEDGQREQGDQGTPEPIGEQEYIGDGLGVGVGEGAVAAHEVLGEHVVEAAPAGDTEDLDLPMLAGTLGPQFGPDGVASTGIAWVPARRDELVRTIEHEWLHQVEDRLRRRGGMPWWPGPHDASDLGFPTEAEALCALVRDLTPPGLLAPRRVARLPAGRAYPWAEVHRDPWRRLPLLGQAALAALVGRPDLRLVVEPGRVEVRYAGARHGAGRLDQRLELDREAILVVPLARGGHSLILVRSDAARLVARALRRDTAPVALGVTLPLRRRRQIGLWESGGTATPLLVLRARLQPMPETELEMLELSTAFGATRLTAAAELRVGAASELRLIRRGAHLPFALVGRAPSIPERAGPWTAAVRVPGFGQLPLRRVVRPRLGLALCARTGPLAATRSPAPMVLQVRNHLTRAVRLQLRSKVAGGVQLTGLPELLTMAPGASRALACGLELPEGGPRTVSVGLAARELGATGELGAGVWSVHVATGADFLRVDFGAGARVAPGRAPVDDWRAEPRREGGRRFLRLSDGGGSRFGRHWLLPPSGLSFDTEQFPYVVLQYRATARPGVRAALTVRVGERIASAPMVGRFVRAWDRRLQLERVAVQADGRWRRVVYDLDAALDAVLGPGSHRVRALAIGDTRGRCSNRFQGPHAWPFDLASFAVTRSAGSGRK